MRDPQPAPLLRAFRRRLHTAPAPPAAARGATTSTHAAAIEAAAEVTVSAAGGLWLGGHHLTGQQARLSCQCPQCWNPVSRSRNVAWADTDVVVASLGAATADGTLVAATWSDGHVGVVPTSQVSNVKDCVSVHALPPRELWNAPPPHLADPCAVHSAMAEAAEWSVAHPPKVLAPGDPFGGEALLKVLRNLRRYGVARFVQDGIEGREGRARWLKSDDVTSALRVGPPWESVFEKVFVVEDKADEGAVNHAYTRLFLQLHTDLPYYRDPPGIFMFQCLETAGEGGESFYCDGLWCAEELRRRDSGAFAALTDTIIDFRHYCDGLGGYALQGSHPVIALDAEGRVQYINDNLFMIDYLSPSNAGSAKWKDWSEAFQVWRSIVDDPDNWLKFRMQPGEVTLFDNRRVLHGRGAFSMGPGGGRRTMEGVYLNFDEVHSRLWILLQQEAACRP